MKKLIVTGSLVLATVLCGCASSFLITHPDPYTEMTQTACCRIKPAP